MLIRKERKEGLVLLFAACLLGGFRCGTEVGGGGDGNVNVDSVVDNVGVDNGYDIAVDSYNNDPGVDLPVRDYFFEEELCGQEEFNIARVIPDMLILLDRSNSMSYSPPTPPLWDTIRTALITVTSAMDDSVWFGLMAFPNSVAPNACAGLNNQCVEPAPTAVLVPIKENASADIQNALMSLNTCGGTPIAMSLQSASQYLMTVADDHPKYILLATDGAPNCNGSLNGSTCRCTGDNCWANNMNCLDDARTYSVLDSICADGIKTYVLGMGGATSWTDVLQGMAVHGCTDVYYAAEEPAQIQSALEEIAGAVASCEFQMDCSQIPDTEKVNFYFDGEVVPMDASRTNGWDWSDPCESEEDIGAVEFFGAYCDMIVNGEVSSVSATFGCPTFII